MKNIAAVLALMLIGVVGVRAQEKAQEKPKETCPCSDYRFVAKTEKAQAVAEYWDARRGANVSAGIGALALLFSGGQPTQTVNEASRSYGDAQEKMIAARQRAIKLGGLKMEGETAVVTLKLGEDYILKAP